METRFGQLFLWHGISMGDYECDDCARLNLLTKDCDGRDIPLGLVHGVSLAPLRQAVEDGPRIQVHFNNYGSPDPRSLDLHRMFFTVAENDDNDMTGLAGLLFHAQVHKTTLRNFNGLQEYVARQPYVVC